MAITRKHPVSVHIVHMLTLLQDVTDHICVSVLGGYVQRRATTRVSNQQADALTHTLRQLQD